MNKRLLSIIGLIAVCITILSQCVDSKAERQDLRGPAFAGSASCASCHQSIADSYRGTAHANTSHAGTRDHVKGSFAPPNNVFNYTADSRVVMEDKADGLYQTGYLHGAIQNSYPFDIAIGSGRKAQTYLYWSNGQYKQLPVSYFVPAGSWANSPGFPGTHPKFDRVIPSTCFGCHSSMVGVKNVRQQGVTAVEKFEDNELIYGIDCERCHGAAAEHVNFHTANPQEKKAQHIVRIASLSNQAKLDQCALCHSGLKATQQSMFNFKPGDAVTDYYYPDFTRSNNADDLDVHGNQYQLFTASACFRKSTDMNCSSCHNTHTTERNNLPALSAKCMNCHAPAGANFCTLTSLPAATLATNCIDCHMPQLASNKIALLTNGQQSATPDMIRTHLIRIYPDETARIMATLKKDSVGGK